MAKAMWSPVYGCSGKWAEPVSHDVPERSLRKRTPGSIVSQEQFPALTAGTHLLEIAKNGFPYPGRQWVALCPMRLRTGDRNLLSFPIQIFETKPRDLTTAESINGEQQ